MHELTIIQNILIKVIQVAEINNLKTVTQITISIGKLRQIIPSALEFAFKAAAKNTIAEHAELIVKYIPIQAYCRNCKNSYIIEENIYLCPKCESVDLDIRSGKEIILENIQGSIVKN
jgi:hydrogenase nickel incorporation protein HypA/HybF